MKPGSVIVDMAAAQGGNVAGHGRRARSSSPTTTSRSSATPTWPAGCPTQASQLYGTNLVNLMKLLTPAKDGQLVLDFDDVVQRVDDRGARRREDLAAAAGPGLGRARRAGRGRRPPAQAPRRSRCPPTPQVRARRDRRARAVPADRVRAGPADRATSPCFVLAIVIGYYVIGKVHHALHTPLMSVTNAISGIIVVGALLQIGHAHTVVTVAVVRRDPAGEHQHLRRLRRHPPHARACSRRAEPHMTAATAAQAAYIVAALLFILSLAGLSKHETARAGIVATASPAWRSRWPRPSGWPRAASPPTGIGAAR